MISILFFFTTHLKILINIKSLKHIFRPSVPSVLLHCRSFYPAIYLSFHSWQNIFFSFSPYFGSSSFLKSIFTISSSSFSLFHILITFLYYLHHLLHSSFLSAISIAFFFSLFLHVHYHLFTAGAMPVIVFTAPISGSPGTWGATSRPFSESLRSQRVPPSRETHAWAPD